MTYATADPERANAGAVSLLFDPDFYRRQAGSTLATDADPLEHYVMTGWREGLDPSAHFSTTGWRNWAFIR